MRGPMGVLGLVTASLVFPTHAQSTLDRPVGTEQPDHLDSGTLANTAGIATQVFGRTVRVGGAAWLRLYFGRVELGAGSVVRITSLLDHETQVLDSRCWPNGATRRRTSTVTRSRWS